MHSTIHGEFKRLAAFGPGVAQRGKSRIRLAGVIAPEELQLLMDKVHSTSGDSHGVQYMACALDRVRADCRQKQRRHQAHYRLARYCQSLSTIPPTRHTTDTTYHRRDASLEYCAASHDFASLR